MSWIERIAAAVTGHSRIVIILMLVATAAVGAGASGVEESSQVSIAGDSEAARANDYVRENVSAREANTTTALIAVRNEDGNVLSRESLLRELEYQRDLVPNATINETIVENRSVGIANIVALTAIADDRSSPNGTDGAGADGGSGEGPPPEPTIDEQIAQLESMDDAAVESVLERLLADDSDLPNSGTARELLPRDHEPGSTTADARLMVMTQRTDRPVRTGAAVSERVSDGQVAVRDIAKSQTGPETYLVIGSGLVGTQEDAAIADSLAIVGPLALLFVLVALSIAYRDPLDIALGLLGVVTVLVWTFGVMGWTGIAFNQVMIAAPILLIGLSVDYAFHVIMRYREDHASGSDVRSAMAHSLGGVGPALALVTVTTAIGFLANVTSPLSDLRAFGIVTAAGIGATLLVFGLLIPALKTELDSFLEHRGWDRSARAFGSGGRLGKLLSSGSTLARRAPVAVLVLALLVSAGGAYGATTIDTSYSAEAFLADDPPEWTEELPASIQPSEFFLKDNRDYIYSRFQTPDQRGQILIEGNVTNPETLERVEAAESAAVESSVTVARPGGDAAVDSPLSAMDRTADRNETFNATFHAADTDGDGVPDRDLARVYDGFYAAAPELADEYIHRTDGGEYAALRVGMAVDGNADRAAVATQVNDVAETVETADGALRATATGRPIVETEITQQLTTSVVESLAVTFVSILVLMAVVFRLREGSASLGVVTLVPVMFAVSWLLGTMALLDVPISVITALVGSIAVGLGVDYTIHITERFGHELDESLDPMTALDRTVVGTGGALLSSAVTTAAGFGVLTFALLPGLSQFGLLLAIGIVYAFVASVVVQPSLLVLWARYAPTPDERSETSAAVGDD